MMMDRAVNAGPSTIPTTPRVPTANRMPVEAATEPPAPPPTEANRGAMVTTRANTGRTTVAPTGLATFRIAPDEVLQIVPAVKLAAC